MHPIDHARSRPDHPAVIMAASGATMTFGEMDDQANRFAQLLRAHGLGAGDAFAVLLENRLEYYAVIWGSQRAGTVMVPVSTRLTVPEIAYILEDSEARLLITSRKFDTVVSGLRERCPGIAVLTMDGTGVEDFAAALAAQPADAIADQSAGLTMLYSSGTTGRPKGVRKPMPKGPFGVPNPVLFKTAERYGFDTDTVYLHPSPLYHAAPLGYTTRIGRLGGCIVVMRKFDAEACLANIERYRVTHSQWVPTHFNRLLKLPEATRRRYDLSSLGCAIHAAAPCPPHVKRAMIDWWGPVIEEYYAGSESNGQCSITSAEWLERPSSVGQAKVGTLHICDEAGRELSPGEIGTIYFEGGAPFEYHNDPDKTAASRHPDRPWSTIGDVGYVDDEGYLFLTDRKSFMILSGGVNIYPAEIEALLLTHEAVEDAAVFGIPNEDFGEEVKAVIQPRAGHAPTPALAAGIMAFCRANLSHVKCPRTVDFIAEMPRGDNGKLYKKVLRAPYWETTPA